MSAEEVWVLVEGPFDRCFYDRLCRANVSVARRSFTISVLSDLAGLAIDGKQNLLALYRYLRKRHALKSDFCGKSTVVLFILDKDIDDLEGRKARSPYVMYTELHSVENYVVRFGDIPAALSAAASLDLKSVAQHVGTDALAWSQRAAEAWRPWITCCLLVRRLQIPNAPNYALRTSPIHAGAYGPLNDSEHRALLEKAKEKSRLTAVEFDRAVARVLAYVDRLYSESRHDLVFKGKWYAHFLVKDAETIAGARRSTHGQVYDRIFPCLLGTLDFRGEWAQGLHTGLNQAMSAV